MEEEAKRTETNLEKVCEENPLVFKGVWKVKSDAAYKEQYSCGPFAYGSSPGGLQARPAGGKSGKRLKWVSVETDSEGDSSVHPKTEVSASALLSLLGSPYKAGGPGMTGAPEP